MSKLRYAPLFLLLTACGTIDAQHVNTGAPAAPHGGDVRIVMAGSPEPQSFREIAIIQVAAAGTKANLPDVVQAMKERGRQLGCNSVIRVHIDQGTRMTANGICGIE